MMKKVMGGAIAILLVLILIPLACCPVANLAPTAYIDSIVPSPAEAGEAVTFIGHGTDPDGSVVAYSWNSSIDGQIGITASFNTSALSVGTHNISFKVQDNNGVWSEEVTAQLTVEEAMGMEDAIDVVVEDILPTIPEILAGDPYWCLRLDFPLPEGTVIEEDSGSTLRITLGEEMFFFYLDLAPGAFYEHPVKYILVDGDGNHDEYDAKWWPRIDDEVLDVFKPAVPEEDDVIATNVQLVQPSGITMLFEFPYLQLQQCEGFIVVQGLMPTENLYDCAVDDYLNRINFFNAYKSACSEVDGLVQSQAADVLDEIDNMVADGLNPITITIIAHGGNNYVRLGGQKVWANQFRSKIAEYPDTTFNFIITSCHSGSFIDELETLENVCIVVTASRADESAWPDWDTADGSTDFNTPDTGAEWTSSILETMEQIVDNSAYFSDIQESARYYGVPTTCVLISEAYWGALGMYPAFGMTQDLDLCHRVGSETPQIYCAFP